MALAPTTRLGRYEIRSKIGAGGMGEVYLAEDTRLERKVALKVLLAEIAHDEDRMRRFVQEAKASSALNHPNILTVYEVGDFEDSRFIVTEFIKGITLRERLVNEPLALRETLDVAVQVAAALNAAHEAGIVHRDIKPENVMIRQDGLVKVLDFGLAKLTETKPLDAEAVTRAQVKTQSGMILGTAAYMSPEQARGQKIDARTDLWSLGVVLYEMLTKKHTFAGDTTSDTLAAILKNEPPPLARYVSDVPRQLERIVGKALRKDREERYQHIKDLLIDLKDLKQELEFEAKLERSAAPSKATADKSAAVTEIQNAQTTSGAEYITSGIKQHKLAALAALGTFVIALGVVGYFAFFAPQSPITSIAVLPFENASGDPNLNYLSDGMSESVIDRLSQLPQLKVIARNSSFKYRGNNLDLREVANALDVQAIVTGRVVRRGDSLTIRVEMIDIRDNKQLWGEQFNRQAADALTVQQEIAQTVSEKLRLKLSGAQETQLARRETDDAEAYEARLKGKFFAKKAQLNSSLDDGKKAIEYFQQAIVRDPNYALAYVGLAGVYNFLGANTYLDPKETKGKALEVALKALELDENLAEAHLALANLKKNDWQWDEAERGFKSAIELNPNLMGVHAGYSQLLSYTGRHEQAIAEAKLARTLDPIETRAMWNLAQMLYLARRYDEAIDVLKQMLEMKENEVYGYVLLGDIYSTKGMHAEALNAYQKSGINVSNTSDDVYLGRVYARAGKSEKAREILKQAQTGRKYVSPAELAFLFAALNDHEQALASLEKAYTEHDMQLVFLGVDPSFDSLRDDPRFQYLMRRVGLSQ